MLAVAFGFSCAVSEWKAKKNEYLSYALAWTAWIVGLAVVLSGFIALFSVAK